MKSILKVTNPDVIEFTLTVTMSLGDWKALNKQIGGGYPAWRLSAVISDMIVQADKTFTSDEREVEP